MRIISGTARGRRLAAPPGNSLDIRPTADRAREALFSILGPRIEGSVVLDLFAGTGALGLEAVSRGAAALVLVDFHRQALELIRRNIAICRPGCENASISLLRHDLRKGLPPSLSVSGQTSRFDLIFLDPPYSQELSLRTLEYLANGSLLQPDGVIVAEERSTEFLPEECGLLRLYDRRAYGDTGFWFYRLVASTPTPVEERP